MKKLRVYFITALALVLISACNEGKNPTSPEATTTPAGGSLAKGSGPSSAGQGKIAGTDRVFAFNATTHPNGTVSGVGTLNRTSSGTRFKFSIDCLSVDGNVATMTGTVTESNAYPTSVGSPCWFRVKDNGEGANASPDEMTFWVFCDTPEGCNIPVCDVVDPDFELEYGAFYPIAAGNIQVKP